jgi:hypothetical protein
MDYWNPPKKRLYDLIENALYGIALMAMFCGLMFTVCMAA